MSDTESESGASEVAAPPDFGKTESMSTKDWLGIIFSATALVLSAASYYASNVRIDNDASARITHIDVESVEPDDPVTGYRNGNIVLKIAIANAGNRPAIVTGATYQLSDLPNLSNGGFGDVVVADTGTFPMLIAAKDLRLVNLKIPMKAFFSNFASGARLPHSEETSNLDVRRFFAGLRYDAIDSTGALHSTWSGMEIAIDVSKDRWIRLGNADQRKPYSLTQLLR